MSDEDDRRRARVARRNGLELPPRRPAPPAPTEGPTYPRTGPGPYVEPTTVDVRPGSEPAEPVSVEVMTQQLDELIDAAVQHPRPGGPRGPGGLCIVAVEDDAPRSGGDAPRIVVDSDAVPTVRHDGEDVPHDGDDEGEVLVEGDRHVVDDGKAAGEAMRRERQQRGGKGPAPRHGHGWLDVDAFTDHLRTARLRPLGTGQGTVNVRVSAPLVEALEAYRGEVDVSKRDVVEALLVELLGPPAEGGRR